MYLKDGAYLNSLLTERLLVQLVTYNARAKVFGASLRTCLRMRMRMDGVRSAESVHAVCVRICARSDVSLQVSNINSGAACACMQATGAPSSAGAATAS